MLRALTSALSRMVYLQEHLRGLSKDVGHFSWLGSTPLLVVLPLTSHSLGWAIFGRAFKHRIHVRAR